MHARKSSPEKKNSKRICNTSKNETSFPIHHPDPTNPPNINQDQRKQNQTQNHPKYQELTTICLNLSCIFLTAEDVVVSLADGHQTSCCKRGCIAEAFGVAHGDDCIHLPVENPREDRRVCSQNLYQTYSDWWFQPLSKVCASQIGSFPKTLWTNRKKRCNHHLELQPPPRVKIGKLPTRYGKRPSWNKGFQDTYMRVTCKNYTRFHCFDKFATSQPLGYDGCLDTPQGYLYTKKLFKTKRAPLQWWYWGARMVQI